MYHQEVKRIWILGPDAAIANRGATEDGSGQRKEVV